MGSGVGVMGTPWERRRGHNPLKKTLAAGIEPTVLSLIVTRPCRVDQPLLGRLADLGAEQGNRTPYTHQRPMPSSID